MVRAELSLHGSRIGIANSRRCVSFSVFQDSWRGESREHQNQSRDLRSHELRHAARARVSTHTIGQRRFKDATVLTFRDEMFRPGGRR